MSQTQGDTKDETPVAKSHSLVAIPRLLAFDAAAAAAASQHADDEEEDKDLSLTPGENWLCLSTSSFLLSTQGSQSSVLPSIVPLRLLSADAAPFIHPDEDYVDKRKTSFLMIDIDGNHCTVKDIRMQVPLDEEETAILHYRFSICRPSAGGIMALPASWEHISFTRKLRHLRPGDRFILWESTSADPYAIPSVADVLVVWNKSYQAVVDASDKDDMMMSQLENYDDNETAEANDDEEVDSHVPPPNPMVLTQASLGAADDVDGMQLLTQPASTPTYATQTAITRKQAAQILSSATRSAKGNEVKDEVMADNIENEVRADQDDDDDDETVDPREEAAGVKETPRPKGLPAQPQVPSEAEPGEELKDNLQGIKEIVAQQERLDLMQTPKIKPSQSTQSYKLRSPDLLDGSSDSEQEEEEKEVAKTSPRRLSEPDYSPGVATEPTEETLPEKKEAAPVEKDDDVEEQEEEAKDSESAVYDRSEEKDGDAEVTTEAKAQEAASLPTEDTEKMEVEKDSTLEPEKDKVQKDTRPEENVDASDTAGESLQKDLAQDEKAETGDGDASEGRPGQETTGKASGKNSDDAAAAAVDLNVNKESDVNEGAKRDTTKDENDKASVSSAARALEEPDAPVKEQEDPSGLSASVKDTSDALAGSKRTLEEAESMQTAFFSASSQLTGNEGVMDALNVAENNNAVPLDSPEPATERGAVLENKEAAEEKPDGLEVDEPSPKPEEPSVDKEGTDAKMMARNDPAPAQDDEQLSLERNEDTLNTVPVEETKEEDATAAVSNNDGQIRTNATEVNAKDSTNESAQAPSEQKGDIKVTFEDSVTAPMELSEETEENKDEDVLPSAPVDQTNRRGTRRASARTKARPKGSSPEKPNAKKRKQPSPPEKSTRSSRRKTADIPEPSKRRQLARSKAETLQMDRDEIYLMASSDAKLSQKERMVCFVSYISLCVGVLCVQLWLIKLFR